MTAYRHILLAVDFTEGSEHLVDRARDLRDRYQCRLSILHVVEPMPVDAGSETVLPPTVYLEQEQADEARRRLEDLGSRLNVPQTDLHLATGHTKHEILRLAADLEIDLILVGSHGRHGLALLLGSTANAVLHGAPCDVLAVRI